MAEAEGTELLVCLDAAWKGLPPVDVAPYPDVFLQANTYVSRHVLKGAAPSIALVGLILLVLFVFSTWRFLRCLFACCDGPGSSSHNVGTHKKLKDTHSRLFWWKVVTAVLAVAALAPIVAGMVKLPSHPFSCVVSNSDAAIDEVQRVVTEAEGVRSSIIAIYPELQSARVLEGRISSARSILDDVKEQVDAVLEKFGGALDEVQKRVPDVIATRDDAVAKGMRYWEPAYKAWQGGYGFLILLLLLLAVPLSSPGGLVASISLLLSWLVVWMALAAVVLGSTVFLKDGCGNVERILLNEAAEMQEDLSALPRYYLYGEGGSLKAALVSDGFVDVDQIQADIDRSQAELNNEIKGQLRLQPSQTNAVSDLNAAVDNAQASIDGLIVAAERQPFIAAYTDLKACVCCALGHQLLTQWICVTVAGLLALLSVVASFSVVNRLDDLPSSSCCGFTPHRASMYKAESLPPSSPQSSSSSAWLQLQERKLHPRYSANSNASSTSLSSFSPVSRRPSNQQRHQISIQE